VLITAILICDYDFYSSIYCAPTMTKSKQPQGRFSVFSGWAMLTIACLVGCLTVYYGKFIDEADNLVVGLLIRQGYVLYRDVFSHHFPFPYYWTALTILIFGKSILAARLSFWLFQIVAFGFAMKFSRFHLSLGLAALLWSIIRYLYSGNMVLYHGFSGGALVAIFAIILSMLLDATEPERKRCLVLGVFSSIALFSDPFTIYALGAGFLVLISWRPKAAFFTGMVIFGFLSIYCLYLLASGTLGDFWNSAILFNSQIYNSYKPVNLSKFSELFNSLKTGLDLVNPEWYRLDPLREIGGNFDKWFFTGFLYRFSFLAVAVCLSLLKKFKPALMVYLTGAAILANSEAGMRMSGFVMTALVALFILITQEGLEASKPRFINTFRVVTSLFAGVMVCWLAIRVTTNIYETRASFTSATVNLLDWKSARILETACNQPDVMLADYPNGIYSYWFTGYKPATKYTFLWPWVAKVGQDEIIETLDKNQDKPVLIYMHEMNVWNRYPTSKYLALLYDFLENNYVKVDDGTYLSPKLASVCGSKP
jgi:MFS family permease